MWPFCNQCGTILDPPQNDYVECSYCPFKCKFKDMNVPEVITRTAPKQKPKWVDEDLDAEDEESRQKHVLIDEPCPKCPSTKLYFYTMQLRSVDEGSTVFYECPECNYKYAQNN